MGLSLIAKYKNRSQANSSEFMFRPNERSIESVELENFACKKAINALESKYKRAKVMNRIAFGPLVAIESFMLKMQWIFVACKPVACAVYHSKIELNQNRQN